MCGISGFVGSLYSKLQLQKFINDASSSLQHRGPDQRSSFVEKNVALGISRLAIRDPVHGKQPMSSGDYTLVFNGELYNSCFLKKRLAGYTFRTDCDTEVLLNALIEFGDEVIPQLEGMFAFALWNENDQSLTLARDRWGEKPLYYAYADQSLTFASEIKALHFFPHLKWIVSEEDVVVFLKNSYLPGPRTGWQGIHKLAPGTVLTFKNGELKTHKFFVPTLQESVNRSPRECFQKFFGQFWRQSRSNRRSQVDSYCINTDQLAKPAVVDFSELSRAKLPQNLLKTLPSQLFDLLKASVDHCLISDKPVGGFLSGGIDSTTMAYFLSRANPKAPIFSLHWDDENYSESRFTTEAAKALNLNLTSVKCTPAFFMDHFDFIVDLFDEPFGDESMVPTFCLAKFAKQQVDVVITGDGADELFLGYERYFFDGSFQTYLETFAATPFHIMEMICQPEFIHERSLSPMDMLAAKTDPSKRVRSWVDMHTYLPDDILMKVDRSTMAVGLEARCPFLTPPVTDFALGCSSDVLISNRGKEILREAMKNHLPSLILERKKMGFGVPLNEWLRTSLKDWMVSRLLEGELLRSGWLSEKGLRQLLLLHDTRQGNFARPILNLLVLERWIKRQLQNFPPQQNRPFEPFLSPHHQVLLS